MLILVAGNPSDPVDRLALKLIPQLKKDFPHHPIEVLGPNDDLPFSPAIIIDIVYGVSSPSLLSAGDLDRLHPTPRASVHDYDLGFQLKYLKRLGRLPPLKIIALPPQKPIDYRSLHSILRKLVAQDMQGS